MLTQVKIDLPAAEGGIPSVTCVDTGQTNLATVQMAPIKNASVSCGRAYLKDGRVHVDMFNKSETPQSVEVGFYQRMSHLR